MQHLLQELYGLGDSISNTPNRSVEPFKGQRNHKQPSQIESKPFKFKMNGWQRDIQHAFESGNPPAIIISASPAAGKTNPLMEGYANILLKHFRDGAHSSIPRILFITPRTQLAAQMAVDFQNDVILPLIIKLSGIKELTPKQQHSVLRYIKQNVIATITGKSNDRIESPQFKLKPVVAATYNKASEILKQYQNDYKYIIVDELQEYFPNPGKPIAIQPDQLNSLVKIIDTGMRGDHRLVLATGSVHYATLESFKDFLMKTYKRKVKILGSKTQTNRSKLALIPYSQMGSTIEVVKLIKSLAANSMTNNLFLLFVKKEKPLTQLSSISLIQELIKTLPVINKEWLVTAKVMKRSADEFLKNTKTNPITKNDINELLYFDISDLDKNEADASQYTNNNRVMDENNILYQSVLRGVGFIIGGMRDEPKKVIQSLFMAGKLHTLIATDAVGVGANVLAKRLFIPSFHKFEDGVFGPVNKSNLIQLLNRAGRNPGKIPNAAIYVRPQDLDYAREVLNSNPDTAPGQVDIELVLNKIKGQVYENSPTMVKLGLYIKSLFVGER